MAVDLFRSPRSKGGFGKMDDWADFSQAPVGAPNHLVPVLSIMIRPANVVIPPGCRHEVGNA